VPIYVAEAQGPAMCALMFRVGRSDETLLNGGVTHLVEHLTLFPLGDQPYAYNGFVDAHRTVFHATGRPEECVEFLAAVTASLSDLPLLRLEHEHRVLSAETAGHGSGLFDELVSYRFGPRGYGMLGYPQVGAQTLTGRQVDDWRAAQFTAANAAVVVSGVPVESLRLTLPLGERHPPVMAPPIETDLPAWFTTRGHGIGVSMVAPRGAALTAALRILEKRLQKRLRTDMAVVYHAGVSTQYIDADWAHVVVGCDPLPDHATDACNALCEELARLAGDGPDPAELEADRLSVFRAWDDPQAAYGMADGLALDELFGAERRTPAAIAKSVRSVSAQDVAEALVMARRSALWALPAHVDAPSGMRAVSGSSKRRMEGRRLAPSALGADSHRPEERLVVGDGGVGIEGDGWHLHVDYRQCAGVLAWSDGARVLYGNDGFVIRLLPWQWQDGAKAVAEVDAGLDLDLVVDMGEGDGPPPAPPAAARPPSPGGLTRPWKRILAGLFLFLVGVLAVVMPFTSTTLRPTEIDGVEAAAVPVDGSGYVRCGGSALAVLRGGAEVPDSGPVTPVIKGACEDDALVSVAVGSVCAVAFVGGSVWAVRGWVPTPSYSQRNVTAAARGAATAHAPRTSHARPGTAAAVDVACSTSDKAAAGRARATVRSAPGSSPTGMTMPPRRSSTR